MERDVRRERGAADDRRAAPLFPNAPGGHNEAEYPYNAKRNRGVWSMGEPVESRISTIGSKRPP